MSSLGVLGGWLGGDGVSLLLGAEWAYLLVEIPLPLI